jgi:hypothetical protein
VFRVRQYPGLVFKRYHSDPATDILEKLRVMTANPPTEPEPAHCSIAWPTELVFAENGRFEGFLMPLVDPSTAQPLSRYYNPAERSREAPDATWQYLLSLADNLAMTVDAMHTAGYVIGDLNESNVLGTGETVVTIIDCDSVQVRDPADGRVFPCPVGKAEYLAPELQGHDLDRVERSTSADNFSLAVLIYQLLMEGFHPFQGSWKGTGEPPDTAELIRRGLFPALDDRYQSFPPNALPYETLPPAVQALFERAFGAGIADPGVRPTAAEWHETLSTVEQSLATCAARANHVYSPHLSECPWCQSLRERKFDPYPRPQKQGRLPKIRVTAPGKGRGVTIGGGGRSTGPLRTIGYLLSAGAIAIAGLAVCNRGGDDEKAPPAQAPIEAFVKQSNAICGAGDTEVAEAGTRILRDATSTLDQWVTFYLEHSVPIIRNRLKEIDNLEPPLKDKDQVEKMLSAGRRATTALEQGLRDQRTAYLFAQGTNTFKEFDEAVRKLKLTECFFKK